MPPPKWRVYPENKEVADRLSEMLNVPSVVGQLLLNRGIRSLEDAKRYLGVSGVVNRVTEPGYSGFPQNWIASLLEMLQVHLKHRAKVLLIGDYDVDGMTSTTIALGVLRDIGFKVDSYIPHRFQDGYGVNMAVMDRVAQEGYGVVITLDCGITSQAEFAYLKSIAPQVDVVIMDHHRVPDPPPDVRLIINPQLLPDTDPLHLLCTAGIAFMAFKQVCELGFSGVDVGRFVDIAAMGTVADIVPLIGANRDIVRDGLVALANSRILASGRFLFVKV